VKDYSQHGEGRLIVEAVEEIVRNGFVVSKVAVEFGAGDGFHLSNIRGFKQGGMDGSMIKSQKTVG